MLKSAWHLTSTVAFVGSLIGYANALAQEPGSSRANNPPSIPPSIREVKKNTEEDQTLANDAVEPSREGGDVTSLLNALSELRRHHELEGQRVAKIAAKRKAEEKPLLAA